MQYAGKYEWSVILVNADIVKKLKEETEFVFD